MKWAAWMFAAAICLPCNAQTPVPAGTVLPIELNDTVKASHTRPGQGISARIMQDVPLPGGSKIREGAKLTGSVVAASPDGKQLTFQFDKIDDHGSTQRIVTGLRAHASYMAVAQAFIPPSGLDRATPYSTATLILIGGDVSYRGGGPVTHGNDPVGKPVGEGVLVKLLPNPDRGCDTPYDQNDTEQALWSFSSDACAVYGYIHRTVVDRGILNASGRITLATSTGRMKIQRGDGMLLIVVAPPR